MQQCLNIIPIKESDEHKRACASSISINELVVSLKDMDDEKSHGVAKFVCELYKAISDFRSDLVQEYKRC
jgi:hypothetical protein